jgi:hypothetical protein
MFSYGGFDTNKFTVGYIGGLACCAMLGLGSKKGAGFQLIHRKCE